ncbi:hypothetical protein BC938DRAFT_483928 [Jimgerdemannia flammicorona]|uniref:Uncharacterized protein n=1 Tax=Jimgerdemannia flammicorona TaxID=994334 RepID=A0A433QB25_9FUNG|nr:hypothetical protein BC938DRAFT_483928 [Jimgerdemannia flammicorona]
MAIQIPAVEKEILITCLSSHHLIESPTSKPTELSSNWVYQERKNLRKGPRTEQNSHKIDSVIQSDRRWEHKSFRKGKINKILTVFILLIDEIGDDGAKALAKGFRNQQNSHRIQSDIEGDHKNLRKGLGNNKTLTELTLWKNEIRYGGLNTLAKALETNRTLTSLNLAQNKIRDESAKVFTKALETNKTLTSMKLSSNEIGVEGAKAFPKALETNKTLTLLDLAENEIRIEGAKAFAKALETNRTLTSLNLWSHSIGRDVLQNIEYLLEVNRKRACNENDKIPSTSHNDSFHLFLGKLLRRCVYDYSETGEKDDCKCCPSEQSDKTTHNESLKEIEVIG